MAQLTKLSHRAALVLLAVVAGCALPPHRDKPNPVAAAADPAEVSRASVAEPPSSPQADPTVSPVSYQSPADTAAEPPGNADAPAHLAEAYRLDDPCDPFNGLTELPVEQLVAEVQARNPSLQAASAAWRAATERYPQAVSLDDPMFAYLITPTNGLGAGDGGGWMVEASQKIPWAGKRALRGCAASAEADAMRGDIGDVRLRLTEAARTAFYDYYLARRELDANASTLRLVTQFREIAWNKYQVNQTTQQDVLQADVEVATLESRRTELARDEHVAVARINTLLHRAADHPLPPPPATAPSPGPLPSAETLQQAAAGSRPDLYALQARIRTEEANIALACKEYYPDLNVVAKYDGFMPENMRAAVGMDINLPVRYARRSAAAREASERLQQRCAEYQERLDQVRFEVQSALDRAAQSQQVIHLFEEKILPAAQRSVESAQANYTSGKLDFLRLIDAERQVYAQRDAYYQAIAEYHRRLAELERAVGGPLAPAM